MKKITCIYKITCLANGKIYIGSAANFTHRKKGHLQYLRLNKHKNSHLQYAYNLYKEEVFIFEIIEVVDKGNLIGREQYWLDKTRCYKREIGFNICAIAGSSLGVKRSDEFKEKIRLHNINRPQEIKDKVKAAILKANTGRPSWNKGTSGLFNHSVESKNKISEANKKIVHEKLSPAHYANVCIANKKPRDKAYKQKRSLLSSKKYYFICPVTGCELQIENLKVFCQSRGLNSGRMYQVAKGYELHYKGWKRDEYRYVNPPHDV